MRDMTRRRRALMASAGDYVRDGLVFFLDGLHRGGVPGQWTDTVMGKTFTLYGGYAEDRDGVNFVSRGYGLCDGAITSDYANETCEIVLSALSSSNVGQGIFIQPMIGDNVGYSVYHRQGNWWWAITGGRHIPYTLDLANMPATISTQSAVTSLGVQNLAAIPRNGQSNYWAANTTGKTILAGRMISGDPYQFYRGKIFAVRLYNRKLTLEEVLHNQRLDNVRYNLEIKK